MPKITTADCRNFLVNDPETQRIVQGRYDLSECGDSEPEEVAYFNKVLRDAKNSKRWKRQRKYKVGGRVDEEQGSDYGDDFSVKLCQQRFGVDPRGGVIREFWLEDTDHVTVALLEKDGKLYCIDDLSD